MKKLVSLGLVTALSVTGLVACGGNETTPKTEETEPTTTVETPQEKIELKLWLDNDSWAEAMEKGIEEALPNIDIIYENVGAVDARSKIELDGPAGLGGDIFIQTQGGMGLSIESNILLPLGDEMEQDIINRF